MGKTSAKIKRPLWVVGLNIALVLTIGSTQAFANGTPTNLDQTNFYSAISFDLAGDYILAGPIEISTVVHTVDGETTIDSAPEGSTVFETFTGTLDGDGFTISGLTVPLFNTVSGEVKDLNLVTETVSGVAGSGVLANTLDATGTINDVTVTGKVSGDIYNYTGGLVGTSNGSISESTVNADVTGPYRVGGLVGKLALDATITDSHATGDVTGLDEIGGLVGFSNGSITTSTAIGKVTGSGAESRDIGGLVGILESGGSISYSHATGEVSGFLSIGGLVGYTAGITVAGGSSSITNSYATGVVTGNNSVGGLVGESNGSITGSYAITGSVSGEDGVGGLVGSSNGLITNSYATGVVTGVEDIGGLVGQATGDITDSWAEGSVSSSYFAILNDCVNECWFAGSGSYIGGLVGSTSGDITNSHATGNVNSTIAVTVDNAASTVDNPFIINMYSGSYIGGLVGSTVGDITNSQATGNINSTVALNIRSAAEGEVAGEIYLSSGSVLGGLVGYSAGTITDSIAIGAVNSVATLTIDPSLTERILVLRDISTGDNLGGLVGYLADIFSILGSYVSLAALQEGQPYPADGDIYLVADYLYSWDAASEAWEIIFNISDSYAEGNINGGSNIGGLAGYASGRISSSSAYGDVTGSGEYIGGFIGEVAGKIEDSFATGDVIGTSESSSDHGIGGFAGYLGGYLDNTYAEGNVYGSDEVGGLVGSTGSITSISNSYATGDVSGDDNIGGLVGFLDEYHLITNSYATGDVTGDDDIGGLVGSLGMGSSITNSYATGDVIGTVVGGDIGGLVGYSQGSVRNSHATGDVSGIFDVGGLVGDLQPSGAIRNSYATGNVSATGSDGFWRNGWGGLVGEFSGLIENSFATGNVVADYNAGALVGYSYAQEVEVVPLIVDSFATGEVSEANNAVVFDESSNAPVEWQQGLGGFVGCKESYDIITGYACDLSAQNFPQLNQETILSVVNTVDLEEEEEPAFEVVACKNNGLPIISVLIDSYEDTCVTQNTTNRNLRIRDIIQTTTMTQIAKTLGFVISSKFPNDSSISFIKNESELAISKILGLQTAADRVVRAFVKTGEALQVSYEYESKDPIELWVKLADGKWLLAGVATFDKGGKVVLPPMQFKNAGDYLLVLNIPSVDSEKGSAPLNQIGSLTVIVD